MARSSDQDREHREVWELLPWYVNRTLDAYERALVETHLQTCLTCRAEVNALRQLEREVRDVDPLENLQEQSLAAIKGRIAAQQSCQPSFRSDEKRGLRRWLATFGASLRASPASIKGALVVQSALLVVVGVLVALPPSVDTSADYRTLSAERNLGLAEGPRCQIVFAENILERRLRALLRAASARIVDGPSATGVYTVVLDQEPVDGASAAQRLATLRSVPDVRFVEPVSGSGEML